MLTNGQMLTNGFTKFSCHSAFHCLIPADALTIWQWISIGCWSKSHGTLQTQLRPTWIFQLVDTRYVTLAQDSIFEKANGYKVVTGNVDFFRTESKIFVLSFDKFCFQLAVCILQWVGLIDVSLLYQVREVYALKNTNACRPLNLGSSPHFNIKRVDLALSS